MGKLIEKVISNYLQFHIASCYDLAEQLSHYLYFFSFLFIFGFTTQERSVGKCYITNVTYYIT